jgi:hypothetical protein
MRAIPKTLSPALPFLLLVLSVGAAEAEVTREEAKKCADGVIACSAKCGKECGSLSGAKRDTCMKDCGEVCDIRKQDCIVKPGGAEQPGTESPSVQPKGGVQQSP